MSELDIHGTRVHFPFEPYPSQRVYISKVIEALKVSSICKKMLSTWNLNLKSRDLISEMFLVTSNVYYSEIDNFLVLNKIRFYANILLNIDKLN